MHARNPRVWEIEAGGSTVQGQTQQCSEAVFPKARVGVGIGFLPFWPPAKVPHKSVLFCVIFQSPDTHTMHLHRCRQNTHACKIKINLKKMSAKLGVVAHAFNSSTCEAEAGGSPS